MSTYAELKAQAQALLVQAEQLRKQELASVIQDIRAKMKEYGLTVADFGGGASSGTKKTSQSASSAPAKYKGPNGELWAGGLGRKPQWVKDVLAQGKSLDEFLI
jgi:DNA-binding protein H-NS